jgi:hypothetical protein
MPHEELHHLSDFSDERLLITMRASVNDARHIVRGTLQLIEQCRIMLRELDGPPASPTSSRPEAPGVERRVFTGHESLGALNVAAQLVDLVAAFRADARGDLQNLT